MTQHRSVRPRSAGGCIVVTGAASGIGAATARRLAQDGAEVVLADVVDEDGEQVARTIRAAGGRAHYQHADVADEAAWECLVRTAREQFGPVAGLVSNAYAVRVAAADVIDRAEWERQISVSLTGALLS